MSYRLRRKSRPEGDREIHGGPLTQKRFDGGMNIDDPASNIKTNQLALVQNYICKEDRLEARPGGIKHSAFAFGGTGTTNFHAYAYNKPKFTGTYADYAHFTHENTSLKFYENYPTSSALTSQKATWSGGGTGSYAVTNGDSTVRPYKKGYLVFTSGEISYATNRCSFKINCPNPLFGLPQDIEPGTSGYVYRYLVVFSRIVAYSQSSDADTISDDRNASTAVIEHESGTNDKRYVVLSASQDRSIDYGEVRRVNAIDGTNTYTITAAIIENLFASSTSSVTNNGVDGHWTHVSFYRTLDIKANVIDGASSGNSTEEYIWVGDYKRASTFSTNFVDSTTDAALQARAAVPLYTLKTRNFQPLPSGACGEVGDGFIFVSDRSNASPENVLYYGQIPASDENFGYYVPRVQTQIFRDGIRAMRIIDHRLCLFTNTTSNVANLSLIDDSFSTLQYVAILTDFQEVDGTIGIRDWGTLDVIDQKSAIAVCSDSSVRIWDNGRWAAEDLSYRTVNSEIRKIVPASPATIGQGSFGKYYNGAYYLWYSKNTADTYLNNVLRYGFGRNAGTGWSYYTGWIPLPFKTGATVMIDSFGVQRFIGVVGVDSTGTAWPSGYFYWLETFNMYTGALQDTVQIVRVDTDAATWPNGVNSGTEISCVAKFRELTGEEESFTVLHDETHTYYRPLVEADGYRSAFSLTMDGYKNGSTTATDTMTALPKTGDLHFKKELAGKRIQLKLTAAAGAHSIVGVDSHCRVLERINYATAGDVSSSESTTSDPQYQAILGVLTVWHTRRDFGVNRATGLNFTATGSFTRYDGPDGQTSSATGFSGGANYLISSIAETTSSTFLFGIKDAQDNLLVLQVGSLTGTKITIKFTNSTTLSVAGQTVTVSNVQNSAWHLFAIIKTGTSVAVYQNNVLKGTVTASFDAFDDGPFMIADSNSTIFKLFDVRYYNTALSVAACSYWYSDIINNSGNAVCPMI